MKHLVQLSLLLMAIILPVTSAAYDFQVDGIFYEKNGNEATVVNGYNASILGYDGRYIGDVIVPENVTYNDTTYIVTSIGVYAFCDSEELTSVTLPNTIKTIDNYAFLRCYSLTSITIPESVSNIGEAALGSCLSLSKFIWNARNCKSMGQLNVENITELTIGDEVETIPDYFMSGSFYTITGSKIKSVNIPASVTHIGKRAFTGCHELERITVDSNNPKYDSRNQCNAIIEKNGSDGKLIVGCKNTHIPSSINTINDYAFYGSGLIEIDIPNSVTNIGIRAFQDCHSLTNITIPEGISTINEHTFHGCSSLSHVTIPNSVTSIGIYAFNGCSSLTNIDIPSAVTNIGMYAFANCKGLTNITLPSSINHINERTFANCCNLTNITIPNSVTTIGIDAFIGCTGLTNIEIPNSVTTIGNGAFTACHNLTSITLPNSLAAISKRLFSHCSALTSIDIPSSVTYIGEGAFKACSSLTDVVIPNSNPTIDAWAFCDCSSLEHVTLPESVTKVPIYTFAGCTALKRLTCMSPNPPEVDDEYSFDSSIYNAATLSVPAEAISTYQSANGWNRFTLIEDMNGTILGDLNNDHEVNISDINAVIARILSPSSSTPNADINQDGEENISDINSVIDIILNPKDNNKSMHVWLTDGNITSIAMTDMPQITCVRDSLVITTTKNKFCFCLNNVQRITYSKTAEKRAPCTSLNGLPGLNIRHMTIHLISGEYRSCYLENFNKMTTSHADNDGIQHNDMFYQQMDSRDGHHCYSINEIDSITFGTSEKLMPQNHQPISITYLHSEDILPDLYWVADESVADAVHIVNMMWEHGAGDYSIEHYQRLMSRLCNVMTWESTNKFDNYEFIGSSSDNDDDDDTDAEFEMIILNNLLQHSHFYSCVKGDIEPSWTYENHADVFLGKYANEHPDKIFIAGYGAYSVRDNSLSGNYSNNNGIFSAIRESYKSENLMLFSKLRRRDLLFGDTHSHYEDYLYDYIWLPLGNSNQDIINDCHMLYSFGMGAVNDSFDYFTAIRYYDYNDGQTCFPIGLSNDILFSGKSIAFKSFGSYWCGYIYYKYGSGRTFPIYYNVALASLCFQMKADVKNVDELLDMIHATTLTETVKRYDAVQPLHLINPAGFFQRYLMPQSLPETVGEGPYVKLEKGFYKGVIFDIPGAEVNIDGEWVTANAANEDRIKAQDPFTLEWRLNVPKLISMGYGNNDTVTGHIIVVDDQFSGLNLQKEFTVRVVTE